MRLIVGLITFYGIFSVALTDVKDTEYISFIKSDLKDYSKLLRPNPLKKFYHKINGSMRRLKCVQDETHFVYVNIRIDTLFNFNIKTMEFETVLYMTMRWVDPLLVNFNNMKDITSLRDKLWVPDIVFTNARESSSKRGKEQTALFLDDGIVHYQRRVALKVSCDLDLRLFPFDIQNCEIIMGSLGMNRRDVDIMWAVGPVDIYGLDRNRDKLYGDALLVQPKHAGDMKVVGQKALYCGIQDISCLKIVLKFKRSPSFYITHAFVPSIFIVILSWQIFFINPEETPVRLSIGMLSVLSIVTQTSAISKNLPKLPYFNGVDIWLIGCQVQIFTYILIYVFVHLRVNARNKRKLNSARPQDKFSSSFNINAFIVSSKFNTVKVKNKSQALRDQLRLKKYLDFLENQWQNSRVSARVVDSLCRSIFPLLFVTYTTLYITVILKY